MEQNSLGPRSVRMGVQRLASDRLSHFRTEHEFEHYAEFETVEEFIGLRDWAGRHNAPMLILGAGSNILFKRKRVRSLVLKNKLPKTLREIDAHTLEVSSTVMLAQILKWCEDRDLDSFYYLASVPASVGGAIAMNAGRGRVFNKTIYDFVRSVTFLDGGTRRTLMREEIPLSYRQSPFTGQGDKLIVSVVFHFPPAALDGSPRRERISWSKENQDHSLPNCGSVFKEHNWRIMRALKGRRFFTAAYSAKTDNWILNGGRHAWPIIGLIRLTQFAHRALLKRAQLEVIVVE